MSLQSAEEVLRNIPKAKRKKAAKPKPEIVVVSGSTHWTNRKKVLAELKRLPLRDLQYIVTSTSEGAEKLAISCAKELKCAVAVVHPQAHFGANSIYMRNTLAFNVFKPTRVIVFHDDLPSSVSSALYLKLAKGKNIDAVHVTSKERHHHPAKEK